MTHARIKAGPRPQVTEVGNVAHVNWMRSEPRPPVAAPFPAPKSREEIDALLAKVHDPAAEPPKGFIRAIAWACLAMVIVGTVGALITSIPKGH